MKTRTILQAVLTLPLLLGFIAAMAMSGGSLSGQITDPETKQPIEGATVVFEGKGNQAVFTTNEAGYYYASNLAPGNYKMIVAYMSNRILVGEIKVIEGDEKEMNATLAGIVNMDSVVVNGGIAKKPLLDKFEPDVMKIDRIDIKDRPVAKMDDIITMVPGVVDNGTGVYVHGARDGSLDYYINGCKVLGYPNIPLSGIEMMTVYTNFIPAKYGDTNAGVVVIETRNWFTE